MEHALDSSVIATRLRALREGCRLSRNKLTDKLSRECNQIISVESIRKYECLKNKESPANINMSVKVLHALACYFGVSTDYILGRTDIKSPDMSVRAIVEYTGLTEESILYLHQLKIGDSKEDCIDNVVTILEHDILFRVKSNPELFNHAVANQLEITPATKRKVQIKALQERRKYIRGLITALSKRSILTLDAINTLLSNNNHLHLLEEIGKYIKNMTEHIA